MSRRRRDAGFTLVEMTVAIAVFSIGMAILMTSFEKAADFSTQSSAIAGNDMEARRSTTKLLDLLGESCSRSIDTMSRYHSVTSVIDFNSDRFWTSSMRQCSNPSCGFHTRRDLSVDVTRYACSHEYRTGYSSAPVTRGKVWPSTRTTCAFDGNQLMSGANMDGVRLLVARTDGTFEMDQGNPLWRTMVFVFPRRNDRGTMDLVRYELRIEDLLGASVSKSTSWNRWTSSDLDWVDLLDFGTDGTTDGNPDGSVPVTALTSDGSEEIFSNMTSSLGPGIYYSKSVGVWGAKYRSITLVLYFDSGRIDFDVEHYENSTTYWSAAGQVTREPEVLVTDVTEFAVSTAQSDPHDATSNPTGVAQDGIVRVHLGTSRRYVRDGEENWAHHIDCFTVRPRN